MCMDALHHYFRLVIVLFFFNLTVHTENTDNLDRLHFSRTRQIIYNIILPLKPNT